MAHDKESLNDKVDGVSISSLLKNVSGKEKGWILNTLKV